jgi:hypothetical protein
MKIFKNRIIILIFLVHLLACKQDTETPTPQVQGEAPTVLIYSPNDVFACVGSETLSPKPILKGDLPISFQLNVNPANPAISIDNEGVIKVGANSSVGIFEISVVAKNAAGEKTFANAYKINVNNLDAKGISFEKDVKPLIIARCSPCHTNGGGRDWSIFENAQLSIRSIIDRTEKGDMPLNAPRLSDSEIDKFRQWQKNCFLKD